MRLTVQEKDVICRLFQEHFGIDAHLWLFGSRVDEAKRGGDIDLYVEVSESDQTKLFKIKLSFLAALKDEIGDQHIDVVIKADGKEQSIHTIARATGVRLI